MDYSELFEALEELEKERGIPKEYMLQKIEAGLLAALRKDAASSETLAVLVDEDAKPLSWSRAARWWSRWRRPAPS